jgi:hypothetical protein
MAASKSGSTVRLLSVGNPGGIVSGFEQVPDSDGVIGFGGGFVHVDAPQYTLWGAGLLAPRRDALVRWGAASGIAGAEEIIADLLGDKLLVVHRPEPAEVARIAAWLTIRFVGHIAGNGPHRSPRFLIRPTAGAEQNIEVDAAVYEFLLRADGATPMAALCARLEVQIVPVDEVVFHIYRWLPRLLRAGVLTLDVLPGIVP